MHEIVNKMLLAGDTFMSETHLKQPGFTYSACAPFTKNKERIQKVKETGDTKYIYQRRLATMVCKSFDRKTASLADKSASGEAVKSISNQQLANELHKPVIRKFRKRTVYSSFKDNI